MNNKYKNVIIYCRVSSDEQAKGCSLDFQEEAIKEFCNKHQHNIVGCYREDASGKNFAKRPEIQKIMKFCKSNKNQVDLILCLKWNRYSRSIQDAYNNLDFFKNLKIQVNAIEQYLNWDDNHSKIILGVYLSEAEVDNDNRSDATRDGIHQTLEKGRWANGAPRGYKNVKISDYDKYVEVNKEKAPIIQWIFSEVGKGTQTPSCIRRLVERKHNWKINKTSFMDMLRNRFYIGEIRVPEYKGIPEHFVKGIHDAIIDKVTFAKVQEHIDGKRKDTAKLSKKINPDLFLRKFISCPVCGKAITGATSSGNGGKYTYYNCSNDAKHFRCRAEKANELFAKYLSALKPNKEVLELYKEILKNIQKEDKSDIEKQIKCLNDELLEAQKKIENLDEKYINEGLNKDIYTLNRVRYEKDITTIKEKLDILDNPNRTNIKPKLNYSINLINNIDYYIREAKVETKCKLISSIFPEKVVFDGKSYRTNSYNSVLDLIYQETKELRGGKEKSGKDISTFSTSVPRAGIEPAWK